MNEQEHHARKAAAESVIRYAEGWLHGAGHMGAASYLRNHMVEIVGQMADDGCLPELT